MFKVHGVNMFPSQVEEILGMVDGVSSEYNINIAHDESINRDVILVTVEAEGRVSFDKTGDTIRELFKSKLSVTPKITVVPVGTLPRTEKKAKRVIDHRIIGYIQQNLPLFDGRFFVTSLLFRKRLRPEAYKIVPGNAGHRYFIMKLNIFFRLKVPFSAVISSSIFFTPTTLETSRQVAIAAIGIITEFVRKSKKSSICIPSICAKPSGP